MPSLDFKTKPVKTSRHYLLRHRLHRCPTRHSSQTLELRRESGNPAGSPASPPPPFPCQAERSPPLTPAPLWPVRRKGSSRPGLEPPPGAARLSLRPHRSPGQRLERGRWQLVPEEENKAKQSCQQQILGC